MLKFCLYGTSGSDTATKPTQLDTHKWHAKRMHMTSDRWGHVLAKNSGDKGLSGDLKIATGKGGACVVHDASYNTCIMINAKHQEQILKLFAVLIDPSQHLAAEKAWLGGSLVVST